MKLRIKMPQNKLYKYRCEELVCNALVRSDKWNEHGRKKYILKYKKGLEIKKRNSFHLGRLRQ